jgi:hypothetical protein
MKPNCGIEKEVVRFIFIALIVCIIGGLVITYKRDQDSAWVKDLGLVLAGGLVGLLANVKSGSTPGTKDNPVSTEVINTPKNPVEVHEVKQ